MDLETWISAETDKAPPLPGRVRDSYDLKEFSGLLMFASARGLASWTDPTVNSDAA